MKLIYVAVAELISQKTHIRKWTDLKAGFSDAGLIVHLIFTQILYVPDAVPNPPCAVYGRRTLLSDLPDN